MTLETSVFNSLPCVMFINTALGARKVMVCASVSIAEKEAARLRNCPHISDVQVIDAQVKSD